MNKLRELLYKLYKEALYNLQIGYQLDQCNINTMWEIMMSLIYTEFEVSEEDILYVLEHYDLNLV